MKENPPEKGILKVIVDGKEREITFEELCLTNNLSQEALITLLVKKGIIDPNEFLDELKRLEKERLKKL
ncbi:hypothetical protein JXI42_05060 [bacterium]|nr:hypothetical protein [bacterium]